jgi:hypothetical protein
LNEGKLQIVLGLRFERLGQRRIVVVLAGSHLANTADPALNLIQQLSPMPHEHPPYILARHPHMICTEGDATEVRCGERQSLVTVALRGASAVQAAVRMQSVSPVTTGRTTCRSVA